MNWRTLQGPSVLAAEIGMLKVLKDKIMLERLARQSEWAGAVGAGGSTKRKSSKMWQTKDIAQLFSNRELKIRRRRASATADLVKG